MCRSNFFFVKLRFLIKYSKFEFSKDYLNKVAILIKFTWKNSKNFNDLYNGLDFFKLSNLQLDTWFGPQKSLQLKVVQRGSKNQWGKLNPSSSRKGKFISMSGTSVIFFAIALKNEEELHSLLDNFNRHKKTLSIVLIRRWTKLN